MTSVGRHNHNQDFLRELYVASFAGEMEAFPNAMARDFEAHVSPQLPWGGVHRGPDAFVNVVLPQLASAIDLSTMRLNSVSADGDRVAALMNARTAFGTDIWLAEHWLVRRRKLQRLMVFCDDARSLNAHHVPTAP
jgi:ketosteroid isomerase-like protein